MPPAHLSTHGSIHEERLTRLREAMRTLGLDYYIVPSIDAHNNEYVPPAWRRLAWITGFTGSAGDALIGLDDAYLWTDSRYFLQAEQELDPNCFQLMRYEPGITPSLLQWLLDTALTEELDDQPSKNKLVGLDPKLITCKLYQKYQSLFDVSTYSLTCHDENLVDKIWDDQPSLDTQAIMIYPESYAGKSTREKLAEVRQALTDQSYQSTVITQLDAIAWLLNIRGRDIEFNPMVIGYLVIDMQSVVFFTDLNRLSEADQHYFANNNITLEPYDNISKHLINMPGDSILIDELSSFWIWHNATHDEEVTDTCPSPITLMKAIKNPTEQQGMRDAHRRDGLAMVKFLCWIEKHYAEHTELTAADQLAAFRAEDPLFQGLSFDTISGYAEHGAIVHYRVTEASAKPLGDDALYLLDSGGQYINGTTDITRTLHFGVPTAEEKRHYTAVLKGQLALGHAIFLGGTPGHRLDPLAHQFIWQQGLDFKHGTGHGVGAFLCVHEGPQSISPACHNNTPLVPGMVVSNEPGIYLEGRYGIRIENVCLVTEKKPADPSTAEAAPCYGFEYLTCVPYERKLIDTTCLSPEEIQWINNYHRWVFEQLAPDVENNTRAWLQAATEPLRN